MDDVDVIPNSLSSVSAVGPRTDMVGGNLEDSSRAGLPLNEDLIRSLVVDGKRLSHLMIISQSYKDTVLRHHSQHTVQEM